jgi:hypothetical protein
MRNIRFDEVAGQFARREIAGIRLHSGCAEVGCRCSIYPTDHDGDLPAQVVSHRGIAIGQPLSTWLQQISIWAGRPVHGEVAATVSGVVATISDLDLGGTHEGMTYLDWEANFGATPFAEWCEHQGYDLAKTSALAHYKYQRYLDGVAQMIDSTP